MKRYEGMLRRLSILFILINLLSPLSTASAIAQDPPVSNESSPTAIVDANGNGVDDSIDAANAEAEAQRIAEEQAAHYSEYGHLLAKARTLLTSISTMS